ncbi:MAG: hypothetical protein WAM60_13200, partial [Candidatus Promineifilaceae bacterium]
MGSFDWQTEEDGVFGETLPAPEESAGNGRKWLPLVMVVVAVVLISGLLYWQIRGRVGGAEEARNEDVVAVNNLLVYAAGRKDPSALLNILPLENATWIGIQRTIAGKGLLLDRWPLGMEWTGEEPVVKTVALSPDLESADVTVEIPYQVNNQGRAEEVWLQQIYHYQFRNEWQWVEPDDDYWGGKDGGIFQGSILSANYPRRDEELVLRLMRDIKPYLDDLCDGPGEPSCGDALDIYIYFEREAGVWLDLAANVEFNGSYVPHFLTSPIRSNMIVLPTPSLVGIPVDEAGYQALLRGYASHILSAVLAELYQDDCCPDGLTFPLFLEGELARRGLGFWPPPILEQETGGKADPEDLPDKDVALLCTTAERGRMALTRFNPASGQSWPVLFGRNITSLQPAPNGQGIIAQEVEQVDDEEVLTRIIFWHDSTAQILYEETLPEPVFAATSWQVHQDEQRLLMVQPDLDNRTNSLTLIDLSDCAAGNCPKTTYQMNGGAIWSPDSSQFLIKSGNILWWRQFVGDKVNQQPLGLATVPFWLDENTFGFVKTGENRLQEIVTADVGDEEMTTVLDSERLRLILSEADRPEKLM